MNNNQLYKNERRIVCSSFCRIRSRHAFRLSVVSVNANKRAAFLREKGEKKERDIFGNTEKKSLLWIGRLTNSTIVLESRSSRLAFFVFLYHSRLFLPSRPLSVSPIGSYEFPSLSSRRRQAADRVECVEPPPYALLCVRVSCPYETTCGVAYVFAHHLSPVPREGRARSRSHSRACMRDTQYTHGDPKGILPLFLSRSKRVCDGDSYVNSRLRARAAHARLASR